MTAANFSAPSHHGQDCTKPSQGSQQGPLSIALLGYRSHPHVGGQGVYLKHLSRALAQQGHSVDVLSGPPYPELDSNVRLIKIPSLNLYENRHHILALRFKHLASFADLSEWWSMATGGFGEPYSFGRRVQAYLREHGRHYDVIHDNQSLCYGILNLQRDGFPVVATVHHPISRDKRLAIEDAPTQLAKWGARRWYHFTRMQSYVTRHLNHIITVSEFSKIDIAEQFNCSANKISVIKNGVDTLTFRPLPDIAPKPFSLITTTSSDQPIKGFAVLLQALKQVRKTQPLARLTVIGQLKQNGKNQKLLQTLQLQDAVEFIHGLSDAQLNAQYAQAQLAVCPSLYEGFGLPAIEAMAAGVAVISSDGGALKEVVGNAGLVVAAGDADQLAAAITQLLEAPEKRQQLQKLGLSRVSAHFCWPQVAAQLTQLYRVICKNKSGARNANH